MSELTLGIDIGTTSVKVCVVNAKSHEIVAIHKKDTQANVPSDQGTDGNKQDVPKIVSALNTVVAKFPKDLLRQVGTSIKEIRVQQIAQELINFLCVFVDVIYR